MLCARALAARVMVASVSGESRVAAALQDVVSRVHDAAQKAGHPPAVRPSCSLLDCCVNVFSQSVYEQHSTKWALFKRSALWLSARQSLWKHCEKHTTLGTKSLVRTMSRCEAGQVCLCLLSIVVCDLLFAAINRSFPPVCLCTGVA